MRTLPDWLELSVVFVTVAAAVFALTVWLLKKYSR